MMTKRLSLMTAVMGLALAWGLAWGSTIQNFEMETALAPGGKVEYQVLFPEGYDPKGEKLPLVLVLHGGGGNREHLRHLWKDCLDQAWETGAAPPMVAVMPSVTKRGFYMDFKDGSEKWETLLTGPFIEHLRQRFNLSPERSKTFVMGVSMGGQGALRMSLRHLNVFAAAAAMAPGIDPVLEWKELQLKNRFWRSDELFETAYGKPVDEAFYAANNPAWIVEHNADEIRASGLQIYLDSGDEDEFLLYEAAEFLHQTLWRNRIPHEYHLVRGADHATVGIQQRIIEAFVFLGRVMHPWTAPQRPGSAAFKKRLERLKNSLGVKGHYDQP